jgi:hypothetical protein
VEHKLVTKLIQLEQARLAVLQDLELVVQVELVAPLESPTQQVHSPEIEQSWRVQVVLADQQL